MPNDRGRIHAENFLRLMLDGVTGVALKMWRHCR